MNIQKNEAIEIRLLLEAIQLKYGYDFRGYSRATLNRRIKQRLVRSGLRNISEMQHHVIHDTSYFETLLLDLTVNVTEMFRDPSFFRLLRERVFPGLEAKPYIKIWHAGCASGEEVFSMAILVRELGLDDKTQIYATDVNEAVLVQAREGIFSIDSIKEYTANYQAAGGTGSFGDYYTAHHDSAIMDSSLKDTIVFADHNLVTDAVFGEMDIIVCRNVLIYFDRKLQDRVIQLFFDSLGEGGILCIGMKESLQFSKAAGHFESLADMEKIYRKKIPLESKQSAGCT